MTPSDDVRKPTLAEQIEACTTAAHQAEQGARDAGMSTGGFAANLYAAAATLRGMQKQRTPYPEFCRHPDKCAGLGCCPRDPTCAD